MKLRSAGLMLAAFATWAAPSVQRASCGSTVVAYVAVDLDKSRIRLFWKDAQGRRYASLGGLAQALSQEKLEAATNAGIFGTAFAPLGLHVERGQVLHGLNLRSGDGNFYLKPNGVFLLDGTGARILESGRCVPLPPGLQEATQSGPLLVLGGRINPAFAPGSANRRIRSGIGVKDPKHVYIAVSQGALSFYDFAAFFRDRLGCADALFLDGTISRLYAPSEGFDRDGDFAGLLAVTAK